MFRYLALVWDDSLPLRRLTAGPLVQHLQAAEAWQPVLRLPGLQVFITGARAGSNGAYRLSHDDGVILGKLFPRRDRVEGAVPLTGLKGEDSERILQTQGRALISDWWGRYVAFLRRSDGTTTVLRDPTGALPCFRCDHEGVRILFSWLEDLLGLPGVPLPPVVGDRLAAHLRLGVLGGRKTMLDGVDRILPGEAMLLCGGDEATELLWNAAAIAKTVIDEDPDRLAQQLRETVRRCVLAWVQGEDRILLRLSGGVDSSIIATCLGQGSAAADVLCVNYHSPGPETDERHYARLAAHHAKLDLIECQRDDGYPLERVLQAALTPTPTPYVGRMTSSILDAELSQRHQVSVMFTGTGGDQLFFELRTWWPAADFLRLRGLGRGVLTATMDAARLARLSFWQTAWLALRARLGRGDGDDPFAVPAALVRQEALNAEPELDHIHPVLHETTDLPLGKLNHVRMLLHPISYYDPYERERAPEQVNPLLSQPLIEFCLQLPLYVLTRGGRGRALARQAFASDLPREIAARRSKGGMDSHVKAVLAHNLPLARSLLLDGELAARGLLDRGKVEAALSSEPQTLTVHQSEIHGHIAVEAWLQRWRSESRRRPAE
ncbi:MAG: asparagine synthase [Rubrivivax sp.]|nr:asparagine synthase [Rubrivivax sp.]